MGKRLGVVITGGSLIVEGETVYRPNERQGRDANLFVGGHNLLEMMREAFGINVAAHLGRVRVTVERLED